MIPIYALLPHLVRGAVGYGDAAFLEVWKLQNEAPARSDETHPLAQDYGSLPSVNVLDDVDRHGLIGTTVRQWDRRDVAGYVCGAVRID